MHPTTEAILQFFAYEHLREPGRTISLQCSQLAHEMAQTLDGSERGAEVTAGLRKLLEAKDCFVRASLP